MKNLILNDIMWTPWKDNSNVRFKIMDTEGRDKLPRINSSVVRHLLAYNIRHSRESDDLIAMGTIWSPNAQKNSGSNSANGIQNVTGKSVSMVSSSSSSTTVPQRKSVKPIMVQNAPAHSRSSFSKEAEPRYTDPVIGAPPSFQQRLMELSALESETIRYEKSKKVKKKVRDRDS